MAGWCSGTPGAGTELTDSNSLARPARRGGGAGVFRLLVAVRFTEMETRARQPVSGIRPYSSRRTVPIPAAEPPADQFARPAWPAHSPLESRHSGGRRRPPPAFPDHWVGCRTETI